MNYNYDSVTKVMENMARVLEIDRMEALDIIREGFRATRGFDLEVEEVFARVEFMTLQLN